MLKSLFLKLIGVLSVFWLLIPKRARNFFITGLLMLESRGRRPADGLRRILLIKDNLEWIINERALAYGEGQHPKHRLTNYHDFFIQRITDGDSVLDVGCGYGAVAHSIALSRPLSRVVGIDLYEPRLLIAQNLKTPSNLEFILGDATVALPEGKWSVLILSNILEHIANRENFLRNLLHTSKTSRVLIRVPLFERDWQMPLRRELGVNYFSDEDHKVEHQLKEFYLEIEKADLKAVEVLTLWGEIWADCRVQ